MAENDVFFPKIAESNWWKLRALFKKKLPAEVTPMYLASALSMTEASVRSNIIKPFINLGILDEKGKPTDLAVKWRDDASYPAVCQMLFEKIYPQEVRDLSPSLNDDQADLRSWFMKYCRCGEPAARMFATFYRLLLKADPNPSEEPASQRQKTTASARNSKISKVETRKEAAGSKAAKLDGKDVRETSDKPQGQHGSLPQLHINIQLHIAPETTAEQIDKIFESMARHLKEFKI